MAYTTTPTTVRNSRNRGTVLILLALAAWLPRLPRFAWMPVVRFARALNNTAYAAERFPQRLMASVAVGLRPAATAHAYTNYPNGVMSHGIPAEGVGLFSPFGNVYFVDSGSGHANNVGTKPAKPVALIDTAINKTTASQGDVVIVAAGHAETVANATTIVPDVAGITILGLGKGANRPTVTMSHADGNIPISGANARLINVLVTTTGAIDVTSGVTITGADVEAIDVEFRDNAATSQFVAAITLGTGAARARIIRPVHRGHASGDANAAAITCAVALDGVWIEQPDLDGLYSNGGIYNVTNAMTNLTVVFPGGVGHIRNRHATRDSGISVVATTTGSILSPRIRTATNDADGFNLAIVAAAMQVYDPLVVNADGERGGAWGTASAAA